VRGSKRRRKAPPHPVLASLGPPSPTRGEGIGWNAQTRGHAPSPDLLSLRLQIDLSPHAGRGMCLSPLVEPVVRAPWRLSTLADGPKVPGQTARSEGAVAIYRLLEQSAFNPEQVTAMSSAYEKALADLKLVRTDPKTERLAKAIIEIAQTNVRDPATISALAIEKLRPRS